MGRVMSVHVADVGVPRALRIVARPPRPGRVDGLVHADVGVTATFTGGFLPALTPGRVALIGYWEDDEAVDRFLASHPLAGQLASGWRARLQPLRAFGSWPGVADDVPTSRSTDHEGPVVAVTLAWTRLSRQWSFRRTSAKAEAAVLDAPGVVWSTAVARPPFIATISLWESTRALSVYAYGRSRPAHTDALEADRAKPFHHRQAFIRCRPSSVEGSLGGRNPLAADALAVPHPGGEVISASD